MVIRASGPRMSFFGADMVGLIRWIVVGSAVVVMASAESPRTALRAAPPEDDASAPAAFENEVRPLLAAKCYSATGRRSRSRASGSTRGTRPSGGESGPAVVPGKPDESLLIQAVRHEGDLEMPPETKLPTSEVAALTPVGRGGAHWPETRRASPPRAGEVTPEDRGSSGRSGRSRRRPPPRCDDAPGRRTPIDRFILAALEASGLAARRADADRRTLIRRVTFDLTGLPPTPEEVDAFVADASPDAFERVVDRLLASPALRRALGPALARRRPLRRHRGRDRRLPRPRGLPLSRLRHRRLQRATCPTTSSSASRSPATSWPGTDPATPSAERVIGDRVPRPRATVRVRLRERIST